MAENQFPNCPKCGKSMKFHESTTFYVRGYDPLKMPSVNVFDCEDCATKVVTDLDNKPIRRMIDRKWFEFKDGIWTEKKPEETKSLNKSMEVDEEVKSLQEGYKKGSDGRFYWQKIAKFQVEYDGKNWQVVDAYDTGGHGKYVKCELCNHYPCRYVFVIQEADGSRSMTIGDECVVNYTANVGNAKEIVAKYGKTVALKVARLERYKPYIKAIEDWKVRNGANRELEYLENGLLNANGFPQKTLNRILELTAVDKPKEVLEKESQAKEKQKSLLEMTNKIYKEQYGNISDWERNFIGSVHDQVRSGRTLSERQMEFMQKITDRFEEKEGFVVPKGRSDISNEDLETKRKLNWLVEGNYRAGPFAEPIFRDMYNRGNLKFSDKQKALIAKWYDTGQRKVAEREKKAKEEFAKNSAENEKYDKEFQEVAGFLGMQGNKRQLSHGRNVYELSSPNFYNTEIQYYIVDLVHQYLFQKEKWKDFGIENEQEALERAKIQLSRGASFEMGDLLSNYHRKQEREKAKSQETGSIKGINYV